ncbi:ABC transporter substrate-binding protein [Paenibacillus sp. J2TS4]|uniref:ABC transporter substrate-binding protein n=1 Tax=Paenibacillus sp. J2TS4 TaxID=2807194 RepID=UPI001B2E1AC6|nr:ABC transporter substrate-binding protein [Paenibacillus sp. J2TS4]GIP34370.1 ABC transporter substrate-binding protein [Paenibacillus sp. J2TS4]
MSNQPNVKGMARTLIAWLLAAVLAIGLIGCGDKQQKPQGSNDPAKTQDEQKNNQGDKPDEGKKDEAGSSTETQYPLTITDASGTEITFEKAPERVTSLAPSETEVLFAIGAGDQVVGVDKWSNYPEEAKSKPQVGSLDTNMEALLATEPDLVLASSSNKKVIDPIRELNIPLYFSNPRTLDEVFEKIKTMGLIMNRQEEAAKVIEKMQADKQKVVDAVKDAPKKRVYIEYNAGWTVGDGEFMDELIKLAGGTNVAAGESGWFQIDPEKIIEINPEVILYSEGERMDSILEEIKKRPGWDQIDAVKNGALYAIDENIISRVGPRLTDALLEAAKAIHPDLVK